MKKYLLIIAMVVCAATVTSAQNLINVKDINTNGTGSYPFDFTIANNKLFFLASGNNGLYALWSTKGTTATTKTLSPSGAVSSIADIINYKGKIFFAYDDGINGNELWVSDGTVAGTKLFKDLYPGSTGSFPQAFTVANNKLLFMGTGVNGERRLYVSDGTTAGTKILRDNYINLFNGMANFAVMNNDIYFTSNNEASGGVNCLWKSNGTAAGTQVVSCNLIPGVSGSNYAVLNNKLYFSGFDYVHGSELWVTDGTGAGTHLLKNISADGGGILSGGEPSNLITYSNKVYFQAKDDTHGLELWKTDGTAAGTKLVKDILPGINGSTPYESILFKGLLYFVCLNTQELWKTDGTAAGTKLVKGGLPNPRIAGIWKNKLYLVIDNDYFVWQTDGTNAGTVRLQPANTINGVNSLNNGFKFLIYNDELYLSGNSYPTTIGYELCKLSTAAPLTATANDVNNLQAENYTAGKMNAVYNSPAKQITITNNSRLNFSWQLVSINGIVIKQGTSADAIIHIPVPGIAPGTYFLTCLFLDKKETIKLPVF